MRHGRLWRLLPCGLLSLMAGCSGGEVSDLHQWTVEQRGRVVPHVMPVSKPRPYIPLPYTAGAAKDPFNEERLVALLRDSTVNGQALLDAENRRRREPLESFPLDAMTVVGSLDRNGKRVALLKVDGLLHQVRVGNYLGQNYGLVKQVTEHDITLREIVQDAGGDWIERMTTLELQESKK